MLIDSWNNLGVLNIYRTVDYTDLAALVVLPIAYFFDADIQRKKAVKSSLHPILPILVSTVAFVATSYRTDVGINKNYSFELPKDSLINKINRIDNLNYGYAVKFTTNNPDTVSFSIPSLFCPPNFDVRISVTEIDSNSTILTLISAEYSCPKDKKDKEELTKEFELKIIEKIKNVNSEIKFNK